MSTSVNLYDALGNEYLRKIIADTLAAAKALGVDFFGVGALARNIWYVENDLAARGTKDVDFGVYVANTELYNALKHELISGYGYTPASENAFCLISPDKIPVDFLPFGEIENQGKVLIDGKGLVSIHLHGFKEVHEKGIRKVMIDTDEIAICTIPSVILLKLIAYDDRPEYRHKDPLDIASIMKVYPQVEADFIWSEYSDLYDSDLLHEEIGTIVLGCEVGKLICENEVLLARVLSILQTGIELESNLAPRMIIDSLHETVSEKQQLLKLLKEGIERTCG